MCNKRWFSHLLIINNAESRRNYEDPLFDQKQLSSHQLLVMIQLHFRLKSPGLALEEESTGNYMNLVEYTKLNVGLGNGDWRQGL